MGKHDFPSLYRFSSEIPFVGIPTAAVCDAPVHIAGDGITQASCGSKAIAASVDDALASA
jgi:hypothetical protein